MPGYDIILNEGDTSDIVLNWEDYLDEGFIASGWYKILDVDTMDDEETGGVVLDTTEFTSCESLTITITKAISKIVTSGNLLEKKIILVALTYATSKQKTIEVDFWVRKLSFVAADGVVS